MESTNKDGSENKDCSFEAFKKSLLDAVALSPSSESSGKCNDDNTECVTIAVNGARPDLTAAMELRPGATAEMKTG